MYKTCSVVTIGTAASACERPLLQCIHQQTVGGDQPRRVRVRNLWWRGDSMGQCFVTMTFGSPKLDCWLNAACMRLRNACRLRFSCFRKWEAAAALASPMARAALGDRFQFPYQVQLDPRLRKPRLPDRQDQHTRTAPEDSKLRCMSHPRKCWPTCGAGHQVRERNRECRMLTLQGIVQTITPSGAVVRSRTSRLCVRACKTQRPEGAFHVLRHTLNK